MPRWALFLPVGLLTLVLALLFFRLGWIAANLTETDVINTYAARYLQEAGPGARVSDCVARPGQGAAVWIVVSCEGTAGRYSYHVNRFGGLRHVSGPGFEGNAPPAPQEPRT